MKLAVIYDSVTGNTKKAAEWIAEGMEGAGAEAKIFSLEEIDKEYISEAKGVVIGCPSYAASMTPKMREWLMGAGKLGMAGKLGGAFSTVQYTHGGGELVIQSILTIEMCMGMLCYSGGSSKGAPVIHIGPIGVNDNVEKHNGLEHYMDYFKVFGKRFAEKAIELFER